MEFIETKLNGVYIIESSTPTDERGSFMRSFCRKEFLEHGLAGDFVQCNLSYNNRKNTLRGMHYQEAPFGEGKLIRCVRGGIYDVIVDIRRESSTFGEWLSVDMSSENKRAVYVPAGLAHGFLTLMDNSDVLYQMTEYYYPSAAKGYRWNDPFFKIDWPNLTPPIISEKDNSYPDFKL